MLFLYINEVLVVSDRGKGRKRQAILGEHPSSYNDKGYGKTHSPVRRIHNYLQTQHGLQHSMVSKLSTSPPGQPCPLLPLPGNSRYKLGSLDVPDMVSYPPPQSSSSSYSSQASSSVAMVSGLHPSKMNCTRIFNLFCLYGNIEKVCVCVWLCVYVYM